MTFVDVCALKIQYCTACTTCYAKGECIHDDDIPALYEKLLDADGIVLGSPVYINSVTAQLKTMLDRMADSVHCLHFTGKYGCAVSTAGGAMADETAEYMNAAMRMLGATTVGTVGVNFMGTPTDCCPPEKKAKELGRKLAEAIRTGVEGSGPAGVLCRQESPHEALVLANKDVWTHEFDHWKAMG